MKSPNQPPTTISTNFLQGKNYRDDSVQSRSLTGIAWHKDKYVGTPLDLDDERLKDHAEWLKRHDLTIVKIDSAERHEAEDVYVSALGSLQQASFGWLPSPIATRCFALLEWGSVSCRCRYWSRIIACCILSIKKRHLSFGISAVI